MTETVSPEAVQAILAETGGWASMTATHERLTLTLSQGTKIHIAPGFGLDADPALRYELEPK